VEFYDAQLDIVDCSNLKYYILGDININYIINDDVGSFNNSKWSDLVSKFDLTQFITCPTRVNKKSSTIIDHIYASSTTHVVKTFTSNSAISDHYPVNLLLATSINICKSSKHKVIKYRSFSNFDEDKFQNELLCSGLENIESLTNPNDALNMFYSILNRVLSKHAPIKEKRVKREHQPDWFSDEIKKVNTRERLS